MTNALTSGSDTSPRLLANEAEVARTHLIRYLRRLFASEAAPELDPLAKHRAPLAAGLSE